MSRLLLVSTALLGLSEAVTIELLRLAGTAIAAAAALMAAYWARQGRQHAAGARREAKAVAVEAREAVVAAKRRRWRVRDPEHERVVVVDEPEPAPARDLEREP